MQLRRITTSGNWIPQIDGLRFVAILSVIVFHIQAQVLNRTAHAVAIQTRYLPLSHMIADGNRGVSLFFVISGYVLARPFFASHQLDGKPVPIRSYYLRRLTRIEPPYLVSLLIYTVGLAALGTPMRVMLPHLAASMFYLHGLIYRIYSTINFVAWSLEIEIQFYLIAPLLGAIYKIRNTVVRRSILVAGIVASACFSLYTYFHGSPVWHWTVLAYLQYFLVGFLLADLAPERAQPRQRSGFWDVLGALGWSVAFLPAIPAAEILGLPWLMLVLYLSAFYGPASSWFFSRPLIALAGGMCYSFYLTHLFIISIVFKATRHLVIFHDFLVNLLLQILLLSPAVILFCTLYYVAVERPCMDPDWPRKLREWMR